MAVLTSPSVDETREGRRIRELAREALGAFDLEGADAELLVHTVSSTFRVGSDRGDFALRLVRSEAYDRGLVRSEQVWLESLHRDAGLHVPEPIQSAGGSWIVEVGPDSTGEVRLAALFRWVEGRFVSDELTPELYGRVGEFMARLHRHGETFSPPPGFTRPRYDLEDFPSRVPDEFGDGLFTPRHRLLLREAATLVEEHVRGLGRGPDVYGLIHSDLQQRNFLFHEGEVRAIDFADGGWGYHLYDVAASVVRLTDRDDYPALRDAFLEGYARHRSLPGDPETYLDSFLAARGVFVIAWIARHWGNPRIRDYGREIVPYILSQVRRYLDRRGQALGRQGLSTLSTVAFLRHLQERDIELLAKGDKLGFNAPRGALTDEIKAQLRVRKPELLAFLEQAASSATAGAAPPIEPVDRDGELPLSFPQQRLWFFDQLEPESAAYNIPPAVSLEGNLAGQVLAQCFGEIVRRHEVLRTIFPADEGRPIQCIRPPESVPLPTVDLRWLGGGDAEREARRLTRAEARRPFDLGRGPLLRLGLLRIGGRRHRLLFTMHHIVSDGWSGGVLIRELVALYESFFHGRPSPLEELPIQYADFAHWQRRWLSGETLEAHLAYWRRQLPEAPPTLSLPTDRPTSSAHSYRGAKEVVALSRRGSQGLVNLGRRLEATPFMTLLALYGSLLHRYSGQGDILVGTPIANRTRTIIEGLIGFFVNTLPLRLRLHPDRPFSDVLRDLRTTTLEAHAHQDLPFERLVEDLAPERSLKVHPLFRVMFSFQNAPMPELEAPGLTFRFLDPDTGASSFDLTLSMRETPEGFRGSLTYRTDLFDAATVRRMAGHLQVLAASVVADPGCRLRDLELLTSAERQQLVELNDTDRRPWAEPDLRRTVVQTVEARAIRAPETPAIRSGDETWSYGQLLRRARRIGHRLRRLGVGPDVPVGVVLEPSPERTAASLGAWLAGGAYLPLDPSHPTERLTALLDDAGAPAVIVPPGLAGDLPGGDRTVLEADDALFRRGSAEPLGVSILPESLAYVIYTSGSTGRPKGVEISHASLAGLVAWHLRAFGVTDADRASHLAGPAFDASVWEVWPYLVVGAVLEVPEVAVRSDPQRLCSWLGAAGITVGFVPTPVMEMILASGKPVGDCVRCLLTGGDRLGRRPAPDASYRLVNNYGPTENTVVATAGSVAAAGSGDPSPPSIGRPRDGTETHVVDRSLRRVPLGVVGEMLLGGDGVARGYRSRPRRTAEAFIPDPWSGRAGVRLYRTGDLARWRPDGEIDFVGRMDDQVQIRGVRVEPGEAEAALLRHPAVAEAVVVTVGTAGEENVRLAGFFTHAPAQSISLEELRVFLAERLPSALIPSTLEALETLPLTPNGKVDRRALAGRVGSTRSSKTPREAPRGPTEELLAGIWAEVLEVGPDVLGRHDSFFEVGGHSLLATRMLSRVGRTFDVKLPLERIFQRPTLTGFAREIDAARQGEDDEPPLVPGLRREPPQLSFGQRRLWFLDRLDSGGAVYNVPGALRARGRLRSVLLGDVLDEIVRRHEVLRTTLRVGGSEPCQSISPATTASSPLPLADLSGLTLDDRERQARRLAALEAGRSFDLEAGPLFRVRLVRLEWSEHVLVANLHHVISDGWSLGVLYREIARLSHAFSRGKPSSLPELSVQYADYAAWQRRWLDGARREEELEYWRETLSGAPRNLELPTDRPRPPMQTFRGRTRSFVLTSELSRELERTSRKEGVTLFMTLVAAHQVFLYRHTGQIDLVVGTPIAGRSRPELEDLIGFFVNTLALRVTLDPAWSFRRLLNTVGRVCLEAYGHQNLPFEQLVDALELPRDLASTPVFQVMLVLQNLQDEIPEMPGVELEPMAVDRDTTKFDWTLTFAPRGGRLSAGWEYNADLFDPTTVERFRRHFERLLQSVVEDPDRALGDLSLLPVEEVHQVLWEWNDTAAGAEDDVSLHELFFRQASRTPDAVAVEDRSGSLTYAELARRVDLLARALRARGVGPDVPVGLCVGRSWRMVAGQLAVLRAGGAYLPLDPAYPRKRRDLMLADAGARWVLTESGLREELASAAVETLELDGNWERWEVEARHPIPGFAGPGESVASSLNDRLAYLIYTSGSTGRPKGVAISHRSAVTLIRWALGTFSAAETARTLAVTSICFDLSVFEIFLPLARGGTLVLVDSALEVPESSAARSATLLNTVPSAMAELVRNGAVPPSVRTVNLAGEPLPRRLVDAIYEATEAQRVWNLYGPSEDTTYSTAARIDAEDPREPGIGRPVAHTRAFVLDRRLHPVPLGCLGELYLGGRGLARGYHGRPRRTARSFVPDPVGAPPGGRLYRTGDLVRHRVDGELEFHGRADHQVKLRGHRIELGEIETLIGRHPGIREAAVVVQETGTGERLVAFFVPADEDEPLVEPQLVRFLERSLPAYMVPSRFESLSTLPLSPNGKVDRRALAQRTVEQPETTDRVEPRDPLELQLRDIWQEVLDIDSVGVTENFFDLGGHSLLAIHVQTLIRERLGYEPPIAILFQAPTIERLAGVLRSGHRSTGHPCLVPLRPIGSGAPFFWIHGAGGQVFRLVDLARCLGDRGIDRPIHALQARGLAGEAEPLDRVEDMAEHYLEAMRSIQPEGPYWLAGYSMGGLVAYEIARRLQRAGDEVALLAMFDAQAEPAEQLRQFDKGGLVIGLANELRVPLVAGDLDGLDLEAKLGAVLDAGWEAGRIPRELTLAQARRYLDVIETTLEAARHYRVDGTYEGRIVVFKAGDNLPEIPPEMGWDRFAEDGVETHVLPGDHRTMLEEPRVEALADRLLIHLIDADDSDDRT